MDGQEKSVQTLLFAVNHTYMAKCFGKASGMGVHPRQIPMLKILDRKDGVSQNELCKSLCIKPSTVTVSLKRMEKMQLVRREQDARDQRVIRVYLTDKGKDIIRQVGKVMRMYEQTMLMGLSEAEICLLRRMLEQIRANLEQIPAEEPGMKKILETEVNQE